jgi:hypothetical protein
VKPRHLLGLLLVGYVLFLGWILLNPSAAAPSSSVSAVRDALVRLGLPQALVTRTRVEFVLNAGMFAPLTMLTSLIWPRLSWTHWVAWAFVLSAGVELWQGLFLPARSAQFVDVVANTLGALGGAWVAVLPRRALRGTALRDEVSVSDR